MKKLSMVFAALISTSALAGPNIIMNAHTENSYGLEKKEVWANSSHDIQIINDTNEDKSYNYAYSICVSNHGCQQKEGFITIKPHARFNNHCDLTHTSVYKHEGPNEIIATTSVADKKVESKALVIIKA